MDFDPSQQKITTEVDAVACQTILRAGKALALTGYDFLRDQDFRAEARAEFERSLKPL